MSPEALDAIASEERHTRRVVMIATAIVTLLVGTGVYIALNPIVPPPPAAAAVAENVLHLAIVDSEPAGARVEYDGKLLGDTPVNVQLPVGSQTLRITKDGYVPESLVVPVTAGDAPGRHVRVTLKHEAPVSAKTAPAPARTAVSGVSTTRGAQPRVPGAANPKTAAQPAPTAAVAVVSPAVPAPKPSAAPRPTVAPPPPASVAPKPRPDDTARPKAVDDSKEPKVPLIPW